MSYTIIDIETTGLSKERHKITEIAAARVRDGQIVDSFQTLINPQVQIPQFITKLTGISNAMVEHAPPIQHVLPGFLKFLGKDVFVAHNASFDFGFLNHNLVNTHGLEIINKKLCTRKLANRIFPQLPRKRLQDLCALFEITNLQAHRAMADVEVTVAVFRQMLGVMKNEGISSIEDIIKFENSSRKLEVINWGQ